MSTAAQIVANIANASHSTGPTTETGKATSSQNALKHGLTAQTILIPGEDEATYLKMCAGIFEAWAPAHETETQLIQNLCDTQWRINRCARLEAAALSGDVPDFKALDIIGKHEARLKRIYSTTLKEVREMIFTRLRNQDACFKQAMLQRRADKAAKRPTDLKAFGFDISVEKLDSAISREDVTRRDRQMAACPD